ncbi:LysR family transcriptional regulator [Sulfurifustis variabilis]|uniref:LysR family transcriptional regulator n=1 Tax=Sulfurifustis variabilis TaxID=1675686 RepID=A0A1B4V345_9GAMM|nr:LysR family transcriptional regulator [Sulfurifustis variabilis]BAU47980.1 LysR family transcriptional regulator [Sulfurifustis variabilis]
MRLTLEALEVLDAIQRKGSFAAAAEALHRVPSAVTYTVQKLEEDLSVTLFDRSGHRAVLTDAGRELLREGQHLLSAAQELEARVKRVATGYEVELRIAVNDVIPWDRLIPLVEEFYGAACGTRLRMSAEVYGGAWDALMGGRADLVVGAPAEGPPGGGYVTRPLGQVEWAFMVAPTHALATAPEPIPPEEIMKYRSIAAADSSRNLPPRTSGMLSGQDVLSVPDMYWKIALQRAGLGVGYLPLHMTRDDVAAGRLVVKRVVEPKPAGPMYIAWRTGHKGKALDWWVGRLADGKVQKALLG